MLSIPNFSLPILFRTRSTQVNIPFVSLNTLLLSSLISSVLPNLEVFSWSSSNLSFQHHLIIYHSLFLGTLFFPLILGTSYVSSFLLTSLSVNLPLSFPEFLTPTRGSVNTHTPQMIFSLLLLSVLSTCYGLKCISASSGFSHKLHT